MKLTYENKVKRIVRLSLTKLTGQGVGHGVLMSDRWIGYKRLKVRERLVIFLHLLSSCLETFATATLCQGLMMIKLSRIRLNKATPVLVTPLVELQYPIPPLKL